MLDAIVKSVYFLHHDYLPGIMAKTDSFFIRAKLTGLTAGAFGQTSLDLGAYVDALGKSVLRIHRATAQYVSGGFQEPSVTLANSEARTFFQLTTQSQTALVDGTDKSVICSGSMSAANGSAVANTYTFLSQDMDISPDVWTNGYLVGVEQIYLGGSSTNFQYPQDVVIVLECTVETLNASAAMALALSQQ